LEELTMAKKTAKGAKSGMKKVAKGAKKGAKKAAAKKKPAIKIMTLHGVFDAMAAFEKAVQGGKHPRKADMLKLAADSKATWEKFCLALKESGDCKNPTSDFCEPTPTP
jgi:hypothetical protein